MNKSVVGFLIIVLILPAFCAQAGAISTASMEKKYNVVLVLMDAMRPDHLGCYGYSKDTSSAIDALSRESVLFKNAFCQIPLTLPSVVSIFTSLYPSTHQIQHVFKDKLPENRYTLAQLLSLYGYSTAWFGTINDPHSGSAPGLMKGFDEVRSLGRLDSAERVVPWIKEHRQKPFFVMVHSYQTHETWFPYFRYNNSFSRKVPAGFQDAFEVALKKAWEGMQEKFCTNPKAFYKVFGRSWVQRHRGLLLRPYSKQNFAAAIKHTKELHRKAALWRMINDGLPARVVHSFNTEQMSYYLWLLDSAIYEADRRLVGNIIRSTKELGVYDKTIFIVMSDHGNEYKDHGHLGHGQYVYDESLRIPLIIRIPGLKGGVKVDSLVESIDILPTLCDLLNIPVPFQAQGVSLRSLWETGDAAGKAYVLGKSFGTGFVAIRSSRWKLIMDQDGKEPRELFDLKKDPQEISNVLADHPEVVAELRRAYDLRMKGLAAGLSNASEFMPELDPETRENIQKTGYW